MARFVFGFTNKQVKILFKRYKYISKLKKYLKSIDFVDELVEKSTENNYPDKVWTMWLQGYENAPQIVKLCIDSIKKFSDREVIVLDNENFTKYVNLPKYIMDKYKRGIISNTHFSDIIRLYLLVNYGGTWIDSTTFCTKNFSLLTNCDLFFFHTYNLSSPSIISNWFISSKETNNWLLRCILVCLYSYWKDNDFLVDYFLFHIFHKLIIQENVKAKEIEEKVPFITGESGKNLLKHLNNDNLDIYMIKYASSLSCLHKLTYKGDYFGYKVNAKRVCKRLKEIFLVEE